MKIAFFLFSLVTCFGENRLPVHVHLLPKNFLIGPPAPIKTAEVPALKFEYRGVVKKKISDTYFYGVGKYGQTVIFYRYSPLGHGSTLRRVSYALRWLWDSPELPVGPSLLPGTVRYLVLFNRFFRKN
jgi:hypothetical protein